MSYPLHTRAIMGYVEAHIREGKLNYTELERRMGFSYAHIRDFFKRHTGISLGNYVRTRQLLASAFELLHTDKSVMDLATIFDADDPATQLESEVRKKRLHFGMVFQSFNLFPQYTALENVTLAGKLLAQEREDYKANKKQIFAEIEEQGRVLLAQMGLSDRAGHYPHQLSGGQQQRVAIARALALQPDILCFDEPTSALDPELTGEVLKVIRSLAEQNTTMVIVTHEMDFARDVADNAIFMDGGFIVEEGPARRLIEDPQEERTRQFLQRYSQDN